MKLLNILLLYGVTMSAAVASPGAHGPNGEHLDAPSTQIRTDASPRVDTFTEAFELVGHLQGNELTILVDRYETNEPVLNGKLEVELNGLKAPATFRADHGDYVVNDAAFLQALSKPGKHPLVFTLAAASDSDLLEGMLDVQAAGRVENHSDFPWAWTGAGLLVALVLIALAAKLRRPKTSTGK
jgi:hypothetical protein